MGHIFLIVTGLGLLVAVSMWAALRGIVGFDLAQLPEHCRRQVCWCQVNSRGVYLACAVLAVVGVGLALPGLAS